MEDLSRDRKSPQKGILSLTRLVMPLGLAAYTLRWCPSSLGKSPLRTGAIRNSETSESPNSLACSSCVRKTSVC